MLFIFTRCIHINNYIPSKMSQYKYHFAVLELCVKCMGVCLQQSVAFSDSGDRVGVRRHHHLPYDPGALVLGLAASGGLATGAVSALHREGRPYAAALQDRGRVRLLPRQRWTWVQHLLSYTTFGCLSFKSVIVYLRPLFCYYAAEVWNDHIK